MSQHPRGINPVQLNDVIFTLHAVFVTIITIIQCFIYDVSFRCLNIYEEMFKFSHVMEKNILFVNKA